MKLGIVVAYRVKEGDEQLLELHLSQIEKHTRVPYTIYGAANRLLPKFRDKMEQHPNLRLCDCPETSLEGGAEHAHWLEHSISIALEDNVTHIAVMHVDSFPVRSDWFEELAGKLTDSCVLAAVLRNKKTDFRPSTECLFFHRDFYVKYHPTFLLSDAELASAEYKQFAKEYKHSQDAGIGYGFKVYEARLNWHALTLTSQGESKFALGGIYGDLVFHMGGASWVLESRPLDKQSVLREYRFVPLLNLIKEIVKPIIPMSMKRRLVIPVQQTIYKPMLEHRRMRLFDDPDAYFEYLRTGKKHGQ